MKNKWIKIGVYMLYTPKDINNNSNTNTGRIGRFEYEWLYKFLASVHGYTRRETQFLKSPCKPYYAETPPQTRCVSCRV